jgi:hypothetical protein
MNTDIGILLYVAYAMVGIPLLFLVWEILKFIYYVATHINDKPSEKPKTKYIKRKGA